MKQCNYSWTWIDSILLKQNEQRSIEGVECEFFDIFNFNPYPNKSWIHSVHRICQSVIAFVGYSLKQSQQTVIQHLHSTRHAIGERDNILLHSIRLQIHSSIYSHYKWQPPDIAVIRNHSHQNTLHEPICQRYSFQPPNF